MRYQQSVEHMPPCVFPFEACAELNLDHFLLAGLDAVRAAWPDYPLRVPELQRFGIMHSRSVSKYAAGSDQGDVDIKSVLAWEE